MSDPLVSIIIPAYNVAAYIRESIDSVLAQTISDWELIVVNDGSMDDTTAIVRNYNDLRIMLIEQDNAGVSAARNAGIAKAKGEFVAVLDADDGWMPTNLEEKLNVLIGDVNWVYADIQLCDGQLKPTGRVSLGTDDDVLNLHQAFRRGFCVLKNVFDDQLFRFVRVDACAHPGGSQIQQPFHSAKLVRHFLIEVAAEIGTPWVVSSFHDCRRLLDEEKQKDE